MSTAQRVTFTALFVALGLLLPIAFHMVGSGTVFLPMHIPILLAGFLAGPGIGLITGLLTPGLSHILTGMPPLSPMPIALLMTFELATFGLIAGLLYHVLRWSIFPSLLGAMIAGRVVYGAIFVYLLPLFGIPTPPVWAWLSVSLATSWPGIVVQLIVVPSIVAAAHRVPVFARLRENSSI